MTTPAPLRLANPAATPRGEWVAVGASGALLVATAWWALKGRGKIGRDDWFLQPNLEAWPLGAWLMPAFVLLLLGGLAALCAFDRFRRAKDAKEQRASRRLCLGALFALCLVWPWTLLGPGDATRPGGAFHVVTAFWSDVSNEYFAAAYRVGNARQYAASYARERQTPASRMQAHVATHPPGAVLFFRGALWVYDRLPPAQRAFETLATSTSGEDLAALVRRAGQERQVAASNAGLQDAPFELPPSAVGASLWCAFLLCLAGASATFAIFSLASGGVGNEAERDARGLTAAAFWALCPAFSLFSFSLDALLAGLASWTMLLVARRLDGGRAATMLGAGALWGLSVFVSFGMMALAAVVLVAVGLQRRVQGWRELALFGAGGALAGIVLWLLFPTQPLAIYENAMRVHHDVTLAVRSRWAWAGLNLPLFAAACGWSLSCAAMLFATRRRAWSAGQALGWGALVTVLLLSLSGNVRGEVERLWLFLIPPLAVLAASITWRPHIAATLLVMQGAQTLLLAATLSPLVRPF